MFEGPLRVTTQWRLFELSLCPIGADSKAKVRAAMAPNKSTTAQQAGSKERKMDESLRAKLRKLFRALGITDEEPAKDPAQDPKIPRRRTPKQEKKRQPLEGEPINGDALVEDLLDVFNEYGFRT